MRWKRSCGLSLSMSGMRSRWRECASPASESAAKPATYVCGGYRQAEVPETGLVEKLDLRSASSPSSQPDFGGDRAGRCWNCARALLRSHSPWRCSISRLGSFGSENRVPAPICQVCPRSHLHPRPTPIPRDRLHYSFFSASCGVRFTPFSPLFLRDFQRQTPQNKALSAAVRIPRATSPQRIRESPLRKRGTFSSIPIPE